jgi:Fur family transcriptional regulator, ferric uptake regulator
MERNTRQREAVLAAIEQAGRALSPGEILTLAQGRVASLNLSTIYRQLNALQGEARIVKVLLPGQAARFEAACDGAREQALEATHGHAPHAHHHHHFHCQACDRVFALHACPGPMQELAPAGFVVESHDLTLRGHCADCSAAPVEPGRASARPEASNASNASNASKASNPSKPSLRGATGARR